VLWALVKCSALNREIGNRVPFGSQSVFVYSLGSALCVCLRCCHGCMSRVRLDPVFLFTVHRICVAFIRMTSSYLTVSDGFTRRRRYETFTLFRSHDSDVNVLVVIQFSHVLLKLWDTCFSRTTTPALIVVNI
jgi:hypothetical protein